MVTHSSDLFLLANSSWSSAVFLVLYQCFCVTASQAEMYVTSWDICWTVEAAKDSIPVFCVYFGCPCALVLTSYFLFLLPAFFFFPTIFCTHLLIRQSHDSSSSFRDLCTLGHHAEATSCLPVSFSGCSWLGFYWLALRCFFVFDSFWSLNSPALFCPRDILVFGGFSLLSVTLSSQSLTFTILIHLLWYQSWIYH